MMKACAPSFQRKPRDIMLWSLKLQPHHSGQFSMAVVKGNYRLEDQSQVFTSNAYTFVGICDGHRGPVASMLANDYLVPRLNELAQERGMSINTIREAFEQMEARAVEVARGLLQEISFGLLGHTNPNPVRRILSPVVAERLTTDHNVHSNEQVRNEVIAQHPDIPNVVSVENGSYKIMGIIEVSRSIGDFQLKIPAMRPEGIEFERPVLSAVPDVIERQMTPADKFVILASGTLWDLLTDQAAVDIVGKNKKSGIAKRLIRTAVEEAARRNGVSYKELVKNRGGGARRNVHDDISVVVLFFDQGSTVDTIPPLFYHSKAEICDQSCEK